MTETGIEKAALFSRHAPLKAKSSIQHRKGTFRSVIILLLASLLFSEAYNVLATRTIKVSVHLPFWSKPQQAPFGWDQLTTSPELDFQDCYENFQCARLQLPLDYWNATTDKNISLAVIKLPARVPVTDPRYGGPIITNPGGPGGSGVGFALRSGQKMLSVLDGRMEPGAQDKFFDIISFDPRGIGLTEPAVTCSGGPAAARSWLVRAMEEGLLTSSDAALGRLWSMSKALGGRCSDVSDDHIQHYLSTASVARDMVELIEAHGRWREREAERLMQATAGKSFRVVRKSASSMGHARPDLLYKPGQERIQYWGFSYGSYLGQTFASMFPARIHRFMVDGVVDAEDYTAGLWYDNLVDTEKDMNSFYYNCARVGFPTCPLATQNGTAEQVSQRVQKIINHIYHNPIPSLEPTSEVVSWSDIRNLVFGALYSPVSSFPFLAEVLTGLEQDDAELLATVLRSYHSFSCPAPGALFPTYGPNPIRNETLSPNKPSDPFAGAAIACGDGDSQSFLTKEAILDYMHSLQLMSLTLGDIWATIRMQCANYALRPYHRFTGPWGGNTSHPVLFLSNTADPVTPLPSAEKMVKGFEGARVLVQDAAGHCSLSAFGQCNIGYIRRYMHSGELPPEGTVCGVEEAQLPWGAAGDGVEISDEVGMMSAVYKDMHADLMASGGGLIGAGALGRVDLNLLAEVMRTSSDARKLDGDWWYGKATDDKL